MGKKKSHSCPTMLSFKVKLHCGAVSKVVTFERLGFWRSCVGPLNLFAGSKPEPHVIFGPFRVCLPFQWVWRVFPSRLKSRPVTSLIDFHTVATDLVASNLQRPEKCLQSVRLTGIHFELQWFLIVELDYDACVCHPKAQSPGEQHTVILT